jgi:hypothetical protein
MEDTARQLFGAPSTQAPVYDATPRAAAPPPPQQPLAASDGHGAEEEAEIALQYLEAEWAMRMEAPMSALAALEESLTRQIEVAQHRLSL